MKNTSDVKIPAGFRNRKVNIPINARPKASANLCGLQPEPLVFIDFSALYKPNAPKEIDGVTRDIIEVLLRIGLIYDASPNQDRSAIRANMDYSMEEGMAIINTYQSLAGVAS